MDPEALTPLVAYLGERKLVLGKNKTCRGWGAGGGWSNEREHLDFKTNLLLCQRHSQAGILGPSQLAVAADRLSTWNLWFCGLAGTLRVEHVGQLAHFPD